LPRGRDRGCDHGLGSRGCDQGKRLRSTEPNDESGTGPEQPLDSEVHGPHTAYNQTAAVVVPQLQEEALHAQHMPTGLGSGVIGFAEADSAGPGDNDANEDADDADQYLVEDNEGDVHHQKAPRTVDKGVQRQLRRQRKLHGKDTMSMSWLPSLRRTVLVNPKKIIKSNIVNFCSTNSQVFYCAVSMSAKCPCPMC